MDPQKDNPEDDWEDMKNNARGCLQLAGDYQESEILEAILMNNGPKLDEMRNRSRELSSAYEKFVSDVESGDESLKNAAINSFKRPE